MATTQLVPFNTAIAMSTAMVPNATNTTIPIDFHLGLMANISQGCLAAYTTAANNLITQCNVQQIANMNVAGTVSQNNNTANGVAAAINAMLSDNVLTQICSPGCSAAINGLTAALTPACGDAPILAATTPTQKPLNAANIGSYAIAFNTMSCVRAADNSCYCATQLANTITGAFMNGGTNGLMALMNNSTAVCTPCVKLEVNAMVGLTDFVDYQAVLPAINYIKNATTATCPNLNGASGLSMLKFAQIPVSILLSGAVAAALSMLV